MYIQYLTENAKYCQTIMFNFYENKIIEPGEKGVKQNLQQRKAALNL